MPFCSACGREAKPGERFCQACGRALSEPPTPVARSTSMRPIGALLVLGLVAVAVLALVSRIGRKPPLVYATEDGIYVVRSDSRDPELVVEEHDVQALAVSPDGAWIAFVSGTDTRRLTISDTRGKIRKRTERDGLYTTPVWSPSNSGVAALRFDARGDQQCEGVFFLDLRRDTEPVCVISDRPTSGLPSWSPDGRHIAIVNSDQELVIASVDEARSSRTAARDISRPAQPPAWLSADEVAYVDEDEDVRVYDLKSEKTEVLLRKEEVGHLLSSGWGTGAMSNARGVNVLLGGGRSTSGLDMEMERGDGAHFFGFRAGKDEQVAVAVAGAGVEMDIVDGRGNVLVAGETTDDDPGLTLAMWRAPSSETAYARVRPHKTGGGVRYTIWALAERSGSQSGEGRTPAGRSQSKTGWLPGDDTLIFRGRGGGWITIDARSSDFDTVLELFSGQSATGQRIGFDDDGGAGSNARIGTELPSSGWYTARVGRYGDRGQGRFTLAVEGPGLAISPTSLEEAWPLSVQPGGLWATAAPIDQISGGKASLALLSPFATSVWQPLMEPQGADTAIAFAVARPKADGGEERELRLAILKPNRPARVRRLPEIGEGYLAGAEWCAGGSEVALLIVPEGAGVGGRSLWRVPASGSRGAKRVAKGVLCFSAGTLDASGARQWLQ